MILKLEFENMAQFKDTWFIALLPTIYFGRVYRPFASNEIKIVASWLFFRIGIQLTKK